MNIEKYIEYILTMSMGTVLFDTKNIAFFIANKENDRFTLLRYAFKWVYREIYHWLLNRY